MRIYLNIENIIENTYVYYLRNILYRKLSPKQMYSFCSVQFLWLDLLTIQGQLTGLETMKGDSLLPPFAWLLIE